MKKILIIHNYYQIPGGEDSVVSNEMKMLQDHGNKVLLYTRNNLELKTMSFFRKMMLPFSTIFNFHTYRDIKRIIKKEKIDVVHVHNTLNLISPSVYYAAVSCNVPIVQTVHNFRLLCPGATFYRDNHICEDCVKRGLGCAIKHRCYRGSRLQTLACVISTIFHRTIGIYGKINYICLTEFNRNKLLTMKQIKPNRVFVKPNFVKETGEDIISEDEREDYYIFAGRLDKLKGIDVLLKAWKEMGNTSPKLIICGVGPMEKWCKKFVAANNINAEFLGFVENCEVRKLVARGKALILPTQWYEGFPMSLVEAFSVGTPVICSELGNVGSIVEEGITGYKFKAGDSAELIHAVKRCQCICTNVIETYNRLYTEDVNYSLLCRIYENVR